MSLEYTLTWLILLAFSIYLVFVLVGMRLMVQFFPEGRRWWQTPVQLLALMFFALVVLYQPFGALPWIG